ncbi:hypothetical protein Tco_0503634 [Tanacetum coccineum]
MPLSDKTILDSHCFVHELKKEMNDDLEYVNSLEKELDELESEKADFSNIYDLLLEECVSKDVTCSYLHSLSDLNANTELQCLYLHKVKECECLAQKLSKQTESVNKEVHNKLLKSFAKLEKHSISLELSLQHCKEQMKNNPVCKENASNVFRKEREQYHEIQDLKAQMQDKNMVINELKKLILVTKGKSVETQFDKPSVVRQPNAQRIPKPSVLGKPTPFSNSFSNSPEMRRMFRIASTTTQTRTPQLPHASRNTNPHMSKSSGVIHTTSVSRPQLKTTSKDKGGHAPNIASEVYKKKEEEDTPKDSKSYKRKQNHDACVSRYLKDVNARTKKANCNSDTTIQKSKSYYKELYENTNQEWKWWIAKRCPTGYTWTQKPLRTKKIWMPKIRKADESTSISPTIDIVSRITNIVQLILFIVDSGCTKHMTGNLKLLCNFVEKFLGTVRFGNDQFAPILGYGDLIQGNVTIKRVYYVGRPQSQSFISGLVHSVILIWRSLQETTSSLQSDLWLKLSPNLKHDMAYDVLSHLNFDYITLLSKKDVVTGLPKLKYNTLGLLSTIKDETTKVHKDLFHDDSTQTSSTNGTDSCWRLLERMLSAFQLPIISFWAEAVATACYTQNRSIIISTHGKTAYHIINDRKPSIKHLHIFGCTCYITRDGENLDKMKEKGDPCVMGNRPSHHNVKRCRWKMSLQPRSQVKRRQIMTTPAPPLLEEYYNPTHDQAEENNNDQAPNASFQEDEFINPFCTRVQEIGESSSRNIDNTDVHSFQPQSHDYRWTRDHPLEQVRGNPTMPVQTRRQLATDPEMCMFALTVSIVEPKNIKEAMADSAWIEAMQDELHQFDRLKV